MKRATQIFSLAPATQRRPRRKKRTSSLQQVWRWLVSCASWIRAQRLARPQRKLHLCETVPLGEKRFAAVLEYEGQRFLVGGGHQSVTLLTELRGPTFADVVVEQQAKISEGR